MKPVPLLLILASLLAASLPAQTFVISTIAGGGLLQPAPALTAGIERPLAEAADTAGNIYFTSLSMVFKLDPAGTVTRVAGLSTYGFSGDGGPATSAQLDSPTAVAADRLGNLYIAEAGGHIRKVSAEGIITTIAGNGVCHGGCFTDGAGDGGPATSAQLFVPYQLAVDPAGNLYLGEWNTSRVRKISADGTITTVVGTGAYGYSGDGGPAASAQIGAPWGLAFDAAGNLYITDATPGDDVVPDATRIRKVSPDGIITTIAGTGAVGYAGDGGPAMSAHFYEPGPIAADSNGNVYVSDWTRIRKISIDGTISTVAGTGTFGYSGDGGPGDSAEISISSYGEGLGLAISAAGDLYLADTSNNRIRKMSAAGIISTAAGSGAGCCFSGDDGPATMAQIYVPTGIAVDNSGNVYFADTYNSRIRRIDATGTVTTIAGTGVPGGPGDGGPAANAALASPTGIRVDGAGNLYIADSGNQSVRKVSPGGVITTVAGAGRCCGFSGDGGPAADALLDWPKDIALDSSGNLFIADTANNRIRVVGPDGNISTVAGNGAGGYSGDNGPARSAHLNLPSGVAVDAAGNLYIADTNNYRVRKVSTAGIITTVAGNGTAGYSGDGGVAIDAQLSKPTGLAFDRAGNLYIGDGLSVRMLSPAGLITTVAGTGAVGFTGDGGPAASASTGAWGLAFDSTGNLYVADPANNAIRLLRQQ